MNLKNESELGYIQISFTDQEALQITLENYM